MSFSDLVTQDIRLVILRTLAETNGYSCNESIIHAILAKFGHKVSRDQVKNQLAWLEEQGLVTLETVVDIYVATITGRGVDIADGSATVPGVKRPHPRG
ncbi:ArsR family transcriptional regulator [Geobacter pelophilus]|uniref:ArsR family transcriptional regulator n=1 Tax=Geoanaerobacter pelophilus TaxID=60036 RepID=A0AAW4L862_9BACT|nr:ArsR family transcriptional regulator [Geoanaerobacter pelophilus]MBT0666347.1 ArsR family transcriptional regulator [Geoanaerobacter pelophilus]